MEDWIGRLWQAFARRRRPQPEAEWTDVFRGEHGPIPLAKGLGAYGRNRAFLRRVCAHGTDFVLREMKRGKQRMTVLFVDGMNDKTLIEQDILRPLTEWSGEGDPEAVISAADMTACGDGRAALDRLLGGDVLLLTQDGLRIIGMRTPPTRSIGEGQRGSAVFGPREAFTESLRINTALLRRRIRDPNLSVEGMTLGRRSRTGIAVCYIRGLTNPSLAERVVKALEKVDVDMISDTGQLEQYLQGDILTPFPQLENAERPDEAARALCDGRVVILCDGSPSALLAPTTLAQMLIRPDDRYKTWAVATLERLVRWLSLMISCAAPALYVAIVSFHPGVLPRRLELVSLANHINVPFAAIVEVLLLSVMIELLREASLRMPKAISQTLGIVGGIVIGDAAIRAGLLNPLLVVVAGVTAVCSFALSDYALSGAFRLVKYGLLAATCLLGLMGFALGVMLVLGHLAMISSFGVDYLQPLTPSQGSERRKLFWQMPLSWDDKRPQAYRPLDDTRQKEGS